MTTKRRRDGRVGASTARQPTAVDEQIGKLIRERRTELRLNLQELAEKIGIAVQQLQKYETGENRVSASRLADLAHALGVPVAWFFDRAGAGAPTQIARSPQAATSTGTAIGLLQVFDSLTPENQRKLIEIAHLLAR